MIVSIRVQSQNIFYATELILLNTRFLYLLIASLFVVAVSASLKIVFDLQDASIEQQSESTTDNASATEINLDENTAIEGFALNYPLFDGSESEIQRRIQVQAKNEQEIANLKKQLKAEQLKTNEAAKALQEQRSRIASLSNNNERLSDQVSSLDNQVNIHQFELTESLRRENKLSQILKAERLQHTSLLGSSIDQIKSKIDQKPDLLKTTKSGVNKEGVVTLDSDHQVDVVDVNEALLDDEDNFSGAVEFGFNFERDNQRTKSIEGRLILDYNVINQYNINNDIQFEYENEDGEDTDDELRWQLQVNYNLTPVDTAFIRSDIQRSGFASYKQEDTFTVGHGHIFFNENNHKFYSEFGPGYKLAVPNDGADDVSINEYILRTKLNYERVVTESLQVSMEGVLELGHENSIYEVELKAQNRIYQELYLIFDVNYKYNQNVPIDTMNDELSTGLNLQYAF